MKNYTSVTKIKNYLSIDIAPELETQVEEWIASMEDYIDGYTGRNFKADIDASVKKYEVEKRYDTFGTRPVLGLFIDDCVTVSELKIDDVLIPNTEYLLYPINSLPITRIKIKKNSNYYFTVGEQNISVKAKWGYSVAVPEDIEFACTVLVAGIINYSKKGVGEIASEALGNYSVSYKTEKEWQDFNRTKEILNNYVKLL